MASASNPGAQNTAFRKTPTIIGSRSCGRQPVQLLEQMQTATLAEVPLAPRTDFSAQIRVTMKAGTVEVSNAGPDVLEQILRVLSHAE